VGCCLTGGISLLQQPIKTVKNGVSFQEVVQCFLLTLANIFLQFTYSDLFTIFRSLNSNVENVPEIADFIKWEALKTGFLFPHPSSLDKFR
jgi:hypothetical protein